MSWHRCVTCHSGTTQMYSDTTFTQVPLCSLQPLYISCCHPLLIYNILHQPSIVPCPVFYILCIICLSFSIVYSPKSVVHVYIVFHQSWPKTTLVNSCWSIKLDGHHQSKQLILTMWKTWGGNIWWVKLVFAWLWLTCTHQVISI